MALRAIAGDCGRRSETGELTETTFRAPLGTWGRSGTKLVLKTEGDKFDTGRYAPLA